MKAFVEHWQHALMVNHKHTACGYAPSWFSLLRYVPRILARSVKAEVKVKGRRCL